MLNHLEIYKQIIPLPGDVLEFGVYKGSSFTRLIAFRDLLEPPPTPAKSLALMPSGNFLTP